jgi:hypothetical protein
LRDGDEKVCDTVSKTIKALGTAAATPVFLENLSTLLQNINPNARIAASRAIENLGAAATTPLILESLTKLLHDEKKELRYVSSNILKKLAVISLVNYEENSQPIMQPAIFISAYLAGNIQLCVRWETTNQRYILQGLHDKTSIHIPLSLKEAQTLRHNMSQVISCIHRADFASIKSLLQDPILPPIEQDELLLEYRATLPQSSDQDLWQQLPLESVLDNLSQANRAEVVAPSKSSCWKFFSGRKTKATITNGATQAEVKKAENQKSSICVIS